MAESYRKRLNIRTPNVKIEVGKLSGSNQQKVMLAKWLNMAPRSCSRRADAWHRCRRQG